MPMPIPMTHPIPRHRSAGPWVVAAAALLAGTLGAADTYAVYRSADRGRTWTRSDTGLPESSRINAFAAHGGMLFAETDAGLYRTSDATRPWQPVPDSTLSTTRVLSLAAASNTLLVGTDGAGLRETRDQGTLERPIPGVPTGKIRSLLAQGSEWVAGTDAKGVFLSSNGGTTWTPHPRGLPEGSQVFALAKAGGTLLAGLYRDGLYSWTPSTDTWGRTGSVQPLVLATDGGVLVVGHNPGGIHRSEDRGVTWSPAKAAPLEGFLQPSSEPPTALTETAPVWEMMAGAGLLLAGAADGVFLSDDRGTSWTRLKGGLPPAAPGISFLAEPDLLFAALHLPRARTTAVP